MDEENMHRAPQQHQHNNNEAETGAEEDHQQQHVEEEDGCEEQEDILGADIDEYGLPMAQEHPTNA